MAYSKIVPAQTLTTPLRHTVSQDSILYPSPLLCSIMNVSGKIEMMGNTIAAH